MSKKVWHLIIVTVVVFTAILAYSWIFATKSYTEVKMSQGKNTASWIWAYSDDPAPKNRFTYFRKVVDLNSLPDDATLRLAADSNTWLWINGHVVRRKVARYNEDHITAEVINAGPYLHTGKNVIVALHHNWGEVITFQRTGNKHAGLYIESEWAATDNSWRCIQASEFFPHSQQIIGIAAGAHRIRYPQIIDGRKMFAGNFHDPEFDDTGWRAAFIIDNAPWQGRPMDVETPGQREYTVHPMDVLAAGKIISPFVFSEDPYSIASGIKNAKLQSVDDARKNTLPIINGKSITLHGKAGESHYITFDFYRPVHGYPFLELTDVPEGTIIDFGYCEIAEALYSGEKHVTLDGWINPEGVVGKGYADRYITKSGAQKIEFPDERTARWMAIQIHFRSDGNLTFKGIGIVKSQYPIEMMGSFSCGDERIDQIVKLCQTHAEITMTDSYIDTPGREDGQWLEDAQLRAVIAAQWFNDTKLRQLLLRTHSQQQGVDGNLHPFAPSNYPAYPAPYDWSVQWVATLYDEYMWSGQIEIIKMYWSNLVKYWDNVLSRVDENGIWRTGRVLADIRVGVRPKSDKQSSGMVTPWMIERLRWSVEMAEAIGETRRAGEWKSIDNKMTDAFRKYHIVPASGAIPAHVGDKLDPENPNTERGYSQAGQTVAVYTGLLNRDEAIADINYAFPEPDGTPPPGITRWNNPTYFYRALRGLSTVGYTERAVRHLIDRYARYLPGNPNNPVPLKLQGPFGGPLPEYWVSREDLNLTAGQKNTAQPNDETGSHGWACVPLLWLHESLLGVSVTEPGGGKITVFPTAGGLPYVSGHVVTPKGPVWVYWDPQQWVLKVSIPTGVLATVVMPPECSGKRVEVIQWETVVNEKEKGTFILYSEGEYIFRAY
ncbi:MAG: hypothetical protein M1426_04885 [Patescibacteria group bacterium]|nr:hypothetical protein [Patescibacteria group bacterium]